METQRQPLKGILSIPFSSLSRFREGMLVIIAGFFMILAIAGLLSLLIPEPTATPRIGIVATNSDYTNEHHK